MNFHQTTGTGGVDCPECDGTMQAKPFGPKAVCESCDATIIPCTECGHLVLIPGKENADRGYCPDCGGTAVEARSDDDGFRCMECLNLISTSEFPGDTLTCRTCDATVAILRDEPADIG